MVDFEPSHRIDVLLVEDNEDDVAVAQRLLRRSGALVSLHVCRDGEEALRFLNERGNEDEGGLPDIVLLDLHLPTVNGIEVLRRMKADRKLHSVPIIVTTGLPVEGQLWMCMELGAHMFLSKPLTIEDVVNVVIGVTRHWTAIDRLGHAAA
jgi:CheY-like chemotaxis protein